MSSYNIRKIGKDDIPELLTLCQEHAVYERASYVLKQQKEDITAAIFNEQPVLFCWIAEDNTSVPVGYISYTKEYSTWRAGYYFHMDCLYLRPAFRSRGIGQLLVDRMVEHANALEIDEIQWQTPDTNVDAIRFYERIGARSSKKVRFFLNPLMYVSEAHRQKI